MVRGGGGGATKKKTGRWEGPRVSQSPSELLGPVWAGLSLPQEACVCLSVSLLAAGAGSQELWVQAPALLLPTPNHHCDLGGGSTSLSGLKLPLLQNK